jgi:hypothetical protein
MEPEKDFLENAATMVAFAQKEIKQFLTWTKGSPAYKTPAEEVAAELAAVLVRIKKLQQQYENPS